MAFLDSCDEGSDEGPIVLAKVRAALDATAAVDGDALNNEATLLDGMLDEAHNDAIEAAAKACDAQSAKWRQEHRYAASSYLADGIFRERFEQAERDAAAIRKLKRV